MGYTFAAEKEICTIIKEITMKRGTIKGKRIEKLISRADLAIKHTFFLEANWIIYSIIENRIKSLTLEKLKLLPVRENYHGCIEVMFGELPTNEIIKNDVTLSLLTELDTWRLERNNIMHDLAKEELDFKRIEKATIVGRALLAKIAAVNMKIKLKLNEKN
ncbi:MAG: hypothetical protein MH472_03510 [Bacteroidia bacterium]|nr:hypothetical protein [Bacteroidia bacterium]